MGRAMPILTYERWLEPAAVSRVLGVSDGVAECLRPKLLASGFPVPNDDGRYDFAEIDRWARRLQILIHHPAALPPVIPEGFIYFVLGEDRLKIGYSQNFFRRLAALQTSSPTRLTLIGAMRGSKSDEAAIHAMFSPYRLAGEWFEFSDEIQAWLDNPAQEPQ